MTLTPEQCDVLTKALDKTLEADLDDLQAVQPVTFTSEGLKDVLVRIVAEARQHEERAKKVPLLMLPLSAGAIERRLYREFPYLEIRRSLLVEHGRAYLIWREPADVRD